MQLDVTNLRKDYPTPGGSLEIFSDVAFTLGPGDTATIMGPSGTGKSTLLHILGALDKPTSGRVVVGGTDLIGLSDRKLTLLRRERMGFVFQFFNLIPTLTAEENVLLPVLIAGKKADKYAQRLDELLELVGLTGRRTHRPDELSGGEQQRVAVARDTEGPVLEDEPGLSRTGPDRRLPA